MTKQELIKLIYQHVYRSTGGKRCEHFNYACWICEQWMAYDILKDSFEAMKGEK